jgi:ferrochelatase
VNGVAAKADEIGVLLLNLGGPDSIEAVRPFLFNLFSDREIIRLGPSFFQKPLAYLISTLRHKKTEGYYKLIGGKSPIFDITLRQAKALEEALNDSRFTVHDSLSFKVFIGMRYWHPLIEETVPEIFHQGIRRLIAVGLYPHYSIATTGSSFSKLKEVISRFTVEVFSVPSWHDHPLYIEALVEKIRRGMNFFHSPEGAGRENVHVLFSAHSLPEKFIEEGDPYVEHINGSIEGITNRIKIQWDLSYQSRSGPVKWLAPSTDEMIHELAGRGVKNLLVVPISFVSDHIETLYEIDILYKDMAKSLGIRLERAESLNTSQLFIEALRDIAMKGVREAGWS